MQATKKRQKPKKRRRWMVPDEFRGLWLYVSDRRLCRRFPKLLAAWKIAYPKVDFLRELKRAHAWEVADDCRQQSERAKFLTRWMARAEDALPVREAEPIYSRPFEPEERTGPGMSWPEFRFYEELPWRNGHG